MANQASDYQNNFAAFKAAVKSQPIDYKEGVLHFATITFYGPDRPGKINGQPVNFAPARGYDSPFVCSDWNSGLIYLRKGNDTLVLDFRDPQNPVKTVGEPVSSEFLPGAGNEKPLLFRTSVQ